jgi:hypothetical protein
MEQVNILFDEEKLLSIVAPLSLSPRQVIYLLEIAMHTLEEPVHLDFDPD